MNRKRGIILLFLTVVFLMSCSTGHKEADADPVVVFPDYSNLLQMGSQEPPGKMDDGYRLPVQVYMDNTGSMQAFIFAEDVSISVDPKFVHLMRALRDMERTYYRTCYYTIQQNEQTGGIRDWMAYDGSVYEDFQKPEFYFSWKKESTDGNVNGPLSLLYFNRNGRGLNPEYINIVMTDLAEQNVNNTQLAEEIQKMCAGGNCLAYMLAFQFEYHGTAQVPDPDKMNDIIEARVDGPRPYYVILTGPSRYMEPYMEGFLTCLENLQLQEGTDFYMASTKLEWNMETLDKDSITFNEMADYDAIKEEKKTGEPSEHSKNLRRFSETDTLFDRTPFNAPFAFYYRKLDSISKDQYDWRLNFQIPLASEEEDSDIEYSLDIACYSLSPAEESDSWQSQNMQVPGGMQMGPGYMPPGPGGMPQGPGYMPPGPGGMPQGPGGMPQGAEFMPPEQRGMSPVPEAMPSGPEAVPSASGDLQPSQEVVQPGTEDLPPGQTATPSYQGGWQSDPGAMPPGPGYMPPGPGGMPPGPGYMPPGPGWMPPGPGYMPPGPGYMPPGSGAMLPGQDRIQLTQNENLREQAACLIEPDERTGQNILLANAAIPADAAPAEPSQKQESQSEKETETQEQETQKPAAKEEETEAAAEKPMVWKWITKPPFQVTSEKIQLEETKQEAYSIKLAGEPDPALDTDSILMILTIIRRESIPYEIPDWVGEFDTGLSEDYFQKTYNLQGFYDVLFGSFSLKQENNSMVLPTKYAEIPIILTGLRGE